MVEVVGEHPTLEREVEALHIELIFTVIGGYFDAYSYIAHQNVSANAQTGNVVLLAVFTAKKEWTQALRRIPPIVAWSCGVICALTVGARPNKETFVASTLCKAFETIVLLVLAIYGSGLPDAWIVPILSFVAAVQLGSFGASDSYTFNSTMITGNLKSGLTALFLLLTGQEVAMNFKKATVDGLAGAAFLVGALLGGFISIHSAHYALFPVATIAIVGLGLEMAKYRSVLREQ